MNRERLNNLIARYYIATDSYYNCQDEYGYDCEGKLALKLDDLLRDAIKELGHAVDLIEMYDKSTNESLKASQSLIGGILSKLIEDKGEE